MAYNDALQTITHTAKTIGSSSTAVVAANADRKWLLLVNDSDETIYIKFGAAAVANEGIRIGSAGGSLELRPSASNLYTGAINGICASGSKILLVTEGS